MFGLLIMGVAGLLSMKSTFFPEVESRVISIQVIYPGSSPEEIEEGIVNKIEENSAINKEIEELMSEICHLINQQCKYGYKYNLLLSGGVGEGTKIGFPDEYDYLLMIDGFQDNFTPENVKPGYVKLRLSENETSPFCSEGYFDSINFTSYFYELVYNVLKSPFIENTRFYLFPNEGDFNNERLKKTANFLITQL